MRVTRASLTLRWMASGFVRPNTLTGGQVSTRNLLGFKDGTANPTPSDEALMDELVWVQPAMPSRRGRSAARTRWCGSSATASSSGTAPR